MIGKPISTSGRNSPDFGWDEDWFWAPIVDDVSGLSEKSHSDNLDLGEICARLQSLSQTTGPAELCVKIAFQRSGDFSGGRLRIWIGGGLAAIGRLVLILCIAPEDEYPRLVERSPRLARLWQFCAKASTEPLAGQRLPERKRHLSREFADPLGDGL